MGERVASDVTISKHVASDVTMGEHVASDVTMGEHAASDVTIAVDKSVLVYLFYFILDNLTPSPAPPLAVDFRPSVFKSLS